MATRRFGISDNPTTFVLAVVGLVLIDLARRARRWPGVTTSGLMSIYSVTGPSSFEFSVTQLIVVVGLIAIALGVHRFHGRFPVFSMGSLSICAIIMAINYLVAFGDPDNTSMKFLADASSMLIKLCGIIIYLAWMKAITDGDRKRCIGIYGVSLLVSGLLEMLFAFLAPGQVVAICLATPVLSVLVLLFYIHELDWSTGISQSLMRESHLRIDSSPDDHQVARNNAEASSRRRDYLLLLAFLLCFGVIRALENHNIDIAQELTNGVLVVQMFNASGTILAGIIVVAFFTLKSDRSSITFGQIISAFCLVSAALVLIAAQEIAALSVLTTMTNAAYRLYVLLIWLVPLAYRDIRNILFFQVVGMAAFESGYLIGETVLSFETWRVIVLLACVLTMIVVVVWEIVLLVRSPGNTSSKMGMGEAPAPEAAVRTPEATEELFFSMYVSNVYHITEREYEILSLLDGGHSVQEIANRLVVSHSTAKSHRRNILLKFGVSTDEELREKIESIKTDELPSFARQLAPLMEKNLA